MGSLLQHYDGCRFNLFFFGMVWVNIPPEMRVNGWEQGGWMAGWIDG